MRVKRKDNYHFWNEYFLTQLKCVFKFLSIKRVFDNFLTRVYTVSENSIKTIGIP